MLCLFDGIERHDVTIFIIIAFNCRILLVSLSSSLRYDIPPANWYTITVFIDAFAHAILHREFGSSHFKISCLMMMIWKKWWWCHKFPACINFRHYLVSVRFYWQKSMESALMISSTIKLHDAFKPLLTLGLQPFRESQAYPILNIMLMAYWYFLIYLSRIIPLILIYCSSKVTRCSVLLSIASMHLSPSILCLANNFVPYSIIFPVSFYMESKLYFARHNEGIYDEAFNVNITSPISARLFIFLISIKSLSGSTYQHRAQNRRLRICILWQRAPSPRWRIDHSHSRVIIISLGDWSL